MLLDAWLTSSPARVAIWAGTVGSAHPYMCHHLDWGNSNVILCVVTSRTAKSLTQGATQHVMRCETPPVKASIGCKKVHHLCDIAHREWHLPYCYAMHVLAGETLPPTNVHSGNPIADEQGVSPNPFDFHAPSRCHHRLTELTRLELPF